jgi:type II secretory pathway pseudopilin PulG
MKIQTRRGRAAFTLIELMAVITIIIILAGIVVGGMGYVNEKQARSKAQVQIGLLSKALEEYKLDMGIYPPTADKTTASSPNGTSTSADLYVVLFYEGYDYNKQPTPPANWVKTVGNNTAFPKATRIYLPELDPTNSKQGWVDPVTGTPPASTTIKDPWGNQYCYRTATNANGGANATTQNPDFDLWSMGKDGKTKIGVNDTAKTGDNLDDIRNF